MPGLTRPPMYPFTTGQYPYPMLSPEMSQVAASWHTPSMYPISTGGGFRTSYPASLPITSTSLPSDQYMFQEVMACLFPQRPVHVPGSNDMFVSTATSTCSRDDQYMFQRVIHVCFHSDQYMFQEVMTCLFPQRPVHVPGRNNMFVSTATSTCSRDDFYRFSPTGLIPPHGLSPHGHHPSHPHSLASHPAIVTPGPKQELGAHSLDHNHRNKLTGNNSPAPCQRLVPALSADWLVARVVMTTGGWTAERGSMLLVARLLGSCPQTKSSRLIKWILAWQFGAHCFQQGNSLLWVHVTEGACWKALGLMVMELSITEQCHYNLCVVGTHTHTHSIRHLQQLYIGTNQVFDCRGRGDQGSNLGQAHAHIYSAVIGSPYKRVRRKLKLGDFYGNTVRCTPPSGHRSNYGRISHLLVRRGLVNFWRSSINFLALDASFSILNLLFQSLEPLSLQREMWNRTMTPKLKNSKINEEQKQKEWTLSTKELKFTNLFDLKNLASKNSFLFPRVNVISFRDARYFLCRLYRYYRRQVFLSSISTPHPPPQGKGIPTPDMSVRPPTCKRGRQNEHPIVDGSMESNTPCEPLNLVKHKTKPVAVVAPSAVLEAPPTFSEPSQGRLLKIPKAFSSVDSAKIGDPLRPDGLYSMIHSLVACEHKFLTTLYVNGLMNGSSRPPLGFPLLPGYSGSFLSDVYRGQFGVAPVLGNLLTFADTQRQLWQMVGSPENQLQSSAAQIPCASTSTDTELPLGKKSRGKRSSSMDQKNSTSSTTEGSKNQDSGQTGNNQDKKKPHIKKPLNAFMLYMKEMRAKVVAECTLKESAAINQILGRRLMERRYIFGKDLIMVFIDAEKDSMGRNKIREVTEETLMRVERIYPKQRRRNVFIGGGRLLPNSSCSLEGSGTVNSCSLEGSCPTALALLKALGRYLLTAILSLDEKMLLMFVATQSKVEIILAINMFIVSNTGVCTLQPSHSGTGSRRLADEFSIILLEDDQILADRTKIVSLTQQISRQDKDKVYLTQQTSRQGKDKVYLTQQTRRQDKDKVYLTQQTSRQGKDKVYLTQQISRQDKDKVYLTQQISRQDKDKVYLTQQTSRQDKDKVYLTQQTSRQGKDKWHSLTREEQAKYYEKARQERQLHMQLYPGWSARDNYGYGAKKKKRKKERSTSDTGGTNISVAVVLEQQSLLWHALGREEQAKYYELARRERQLHMQLYPDWSSRANSSRGKKRKRKQETNDGGYSCLECVYVPLAIPRSPEPLMRPIIRFVSLVYKPEGCVMVCCREQHEKMSSQVWTGPAESVVQTLQSVLRFKQFSRLKTLTWTDFLMTYADPQTASMIADFDLQTAMLSLSYKLSRVLVVSLYKLSRVASCLSPTVMLSPSVRTYRMTCVLELLLDKKQLSSLQADVLNRDYLDFVSKQEVIDYLKQFTSSGDQLEKLLREYFSRAPLQPDSDLTYSADRSQVVPDHGPPPGLGVHASLVHSTSNAASPQEPTYVNL
uniref:HMG box domain-containing protein n=1 Tax=Timema douglasi TaxID=61478 RepID=A0A7R8Z8G2_TIMDO|nr:unnamed protein product [Timema douglasi]